MKNLFIIVLVLSVGSLLTGCSVFENDKNDAIHIRISNKSSVDFQSVYISYPNTEETFESIQSGRSTPYRKVDSAYSYGFIEVRAKGREYRLQPIDFVGEESRDNGLYTYELTLTKNSVELNFIEN